VEFNVSKTTDKAAAPPYCSKKSLNAFLNKIREQEHVPLRIDRGLMASSSGSVANETMAALRYLQLIDSKDVPTPLFTEYVMADDAARKPVMDRMVRSSYAFLFGASGFDIGRATTHQVAELFRPLGVNGSTLSRAMSFFLACANEAGVKISPNVKAIPVVKNGAAKVKKDVQQQVIVDPLGGKREEPDKPRLGEQRFEIPIPNKPSVRVFVPADFDAEDWELLQTMFTAYVTRWKRFPPQKKEIDKGPTERQAL
jgi:hypothetical protein